MLEGTHLCGTDSSQTDGKLLRELYDTLQNRMRSLESLGLKPDDNPSLSMVLLPIFETKLPR